jgi:hypothetical protein
MAWKNIELVALMARQTALCLFPQYNCNLHHPTPPFKTIPTGRRLPGATKSSIESGRVAHRPAPIDDRAYPDRLLSQPLGSVLFLVAEPLRSNSFAFAFGLFLGRRHAKTLPSGFE